MKACYIRIAAGKKDHNNSNIWNAWVEKIIEIENNHPRI